MVYTGSRVPLFTINFKSEISMGLWTLMDKIWVMEFSIGPFPLVPSFLFSSDIH